MSSGTAFVEFSTPVKTIDTDKRRLPSLNRVDGFFVDIEIPHPVAEKALPYQEDKVIAAVLITEGDRFP